MKTLCSSCGGLGFLRVETSGTAHQCALCHGRGVVDDGHAAAPDSVKLQVPPERLLEVIAKAHYWRIPGTFMTVCALVLKNGFTVLGSSACASIDEFDAMVGCRVAFDNAKRQIKPLECYALRERVQPFVAQPEGALDARSPDVD